MRRPILYILGVMVLIAGLAVVWYLASPLFINRTVVEAFPIEVPPVEELEEMSEEEIAELEANFMDSLPPAEEIAETPQDEREELEDMAKQIATVIPDKEMNEPIPASLPEQTATIPAVPVLLMQGDFYGADDFHQGSGDALIY